MYNLFSFIMFTTLATITASPFWSEITLGQVSDTMIKDKLIEYDKESYFAGHIVSFLVTRSDNQFNDPNQGMVYNVCEATWTAEGEFAMKITYNYEHPPVYAPPGKLGYEPIDYLGEDLIVWRATQGYVLCTPSTNDTIDDYEILIIDPNGKIIKKEGNQILSRFPIDKPYSDYQFKYFQLPMGKGFSGQLKTISSVDLLPSGIINLKSQGSFGPGFQGNWDLILDPNAEYLVREATFTQDNKSSPLKTVTTSGIMKKNNLTLAKNGVYKSAGGMELSVEVEDISKVEGENTLYNEISSRFKKQLPIGASIIDMRGEKPVKTTVK